VYIDTAEVGVIGGSGVSKLDSFQHRETIAIETPFGTPSAGIAVGTIGNTRVAFLQRHGEGHRLLPSEINFRANVFALKLLGVRRILSLSAVGSLQEQFHPGEFVVPAQFFDHTRCRSDSFFGEGIVAHVGLAEPICQQLGDLLQTACILEKVPVHRGGTYLCIEGPQFSTRAESQVYRSWGMDVIGMTNVQEAKLAREAGICYGTLAMVTDYDCWKEREKPVTVEQAIAVLRKNSVNAGRVVVTAIQNLPNRTCNCGNALKTAVMTDLAQMSPTNRELLRVLSS
jgi:5'-methylthioadenosine phosphorylase